MFATEPIGGAFNLTECVSINCSLNYYGMVNCTSPGFIILYRCQEGLMDLPQARDELRTLRAKGVINFKEVGPSGMGWVEASPLIIHGGVGNHTVREFPATFTYLPCASTFFPG
jgi:hypothetical protein